MRKTIKQLSSQLSFTLIEMLVVVSIIGILLALAIASYSNAQQRARDAKRKTDIEQLRGAAEMFRSNSTLSDYPGTAGDLTPTPGVPATAALTAGAGSGGLVPSFANYIYSIPLDPNPQSKCANYFYVTDGTTYTLFTKLENADSPDAIAAKPTPPSVVGTLNAGNSQYTITVPTCNGAVFNYWTNNP